MNTPWGKADSVTQIAEGITHVSTPSHGGFFLAREQNCRVPHCWRAAGFNGQPLRGWYEEDVDACMVILCFPELFKDADHTYANRTFDHWIKPKLAD